MVADRSCFLYYPLIRDVHRKINYLGETRATLTGLPSDLGEGVRILEGIVSKQK